MSRAQANFELQTKQVKNATFGPKEYLSFVHEKMAHEKLFQLCE